MAPWPYAFWFAHRGAGKLAPENTLAAFHVGASHGYRAFECDVKLSADGVPFLLHDETLQRTTNAEGTAGARSWSELSRLDAGAWHGGDFAGEPLPSLESIARYVQRNGHALNIEIKPTPGAERETGRVVASEAARLWAGQHSPPPLLTSFLPNALAAAREAAPDLPRGLLIDQLWDGAFVATAQQLGCVALIAKHSLLDAALIDKLHRVGLRVLAYTVNDPAEVARLTRLSIDGLITDAVDRFDPNAAPAQR